MQQNNIEQFSDALNIDEYNNVDTYVLTSGILYTEDIIVEVVKAQEYENASDSDSEEETALKTPSRDFSAESLQNLEQIFNAMKSTDDATFKELRVLRRKLYETKFCKVKQ